MTKKIISLSIEKRVYEEYTKLCRERGLVISKQIENFMKSVVDK
jgi:antitoxin component of RelBE/YafQ-DinJ toxin-antitoxin module